MNHAWNYSGNKPKSSVCKDNFLPFVYLYSLRKFLNVLLAKFMMYNSCYGRISEKKFISEEMFLL